ncbi:type II toxin-antitoxin system death-on-curing family toxin [Salipiger abyssi]|uniref:Death on curing protein n=1 Tax=Salipiger abyssi TaxID=1250539 RepID=A0A1P8V146_9RHOB|nr:type II toxin-antitoxin system death-on-curing family toxin [Salipiger abyssi]APZ55359.1 death on curing protein [Salipiger abyssi]
MIEPIWIRRDVIDTMHDLQLVEHGGAAGIRDEGLLDSALAKPRNKHAYGEDNLCELAAAYAAGIARNHPYIDGNKRTAFLAAYVFLKINGLHLVASEVEAVQMTVDLAAGSLDETAFAAWLQANSQHK